MVQKNNGYQADSFKSIQVKYLRTIAFSERWGGGYISFPFLASWSFHNICKQILDRLDVVNAML